MERRDFLKGAACLLVPAPCTIPVLEPLPKAKVENGQIVNPEEILGPWKRIFRPDDGKRPRRWWFGPPDIREKRAGWCLISKDEPIQWINPDDFQRYLVWGRVEAVQGRFQGLIDGRTITTSVLLRDASKAKLICFPWNGEVLV